MKATMTCRMTKGCPPILWRVLLQARRPAVRRYLHQETERWWWSWWWWWQNQSFCVWEIPGFIFATCATYSIKINVSPFVAEWANTTSTLNLYFLPLDLSWAVESVNKESTDGWQIKGKTWINEWRNITNADLVALLYCGGHFAGMVWVHLSP